eukprot:m.656698 g.656698  ORF g.656698 m.656698 type:complete len:852 (-) comp22705_c0_seq12:218-2773(-)
MIFLFFIKLFHSLTIPTCHADRSYNREFYLGVGGGDNSGGELLEMVTASDDGYICFCPSVGFHGSSAARIPSYRVYLSNNLSFTLLIPIETYRYGFLTKVYMRWLRQQDSMMQSMKGPSARLGLAQNLSFVQASRSQQALLPGRQRRDSVSSDTSVATSICFMDASGKEIITPPATERHRKESVSSATYRSNGARDLESGVVVVPGDVPPMPEQTTAHFVVAVTALIKRFSAQQRQRKRNSVVGGSPDWEDEASPVAFECLTSKYLEDLDDAELQGQLLQCCQSALRSHAATSSSTDTSAIGGRPTTGCQAHRVTDYVNFADFFKAVVVECNVHIAKPRELSAENTKAYALSMAWEQDQHAPWKRYAGKRTLSLSIERNMAEFPLMPMMDSHGVAALERACCAAWPSLTQTTGITGVYKTLRGDVNMTTDDDIQHVLKLMPSTAKNQPFQQNGCGCYLLTNHLGIFVAAPENHLRIVYNGPFNEPTKVLSLIRKVVLSLANMPTVSMTTLPDFGWVTSRPEHIGLGISFCDIHQEIRADVPDDYVIGAGELVQTGHVTVTKAPTDRATAAPGMTNWSFELSQCNQGVTLGQALSAMRDIVVNAHDVEARIRGRVNTNLPPSIQTSTLQPAFQAASFMQPRSHAGESNDLNGSYITVTEKPVDLSYDSDESEADAVVGRWERIGGRHSVKQPQPIRKQGSTKRQTSIKKQASVKKQASIKKQQSLKKQRSMNKREPAAEFGIVSTTQTFGVGSIMAPQTTHGTDSAVVANADGARVSTMSSGMLSWKRPSGASQLHQAWAQQDQAAVQELSRGTNPTVPDATGTPAGELPTSCTFLGSCMCPDCRPGTPEMV